MAADETRRPGSGAAERLEEEAHLLDLGDLQQVAMWIATAAASGLIGHAATSVLTAVRKRFGSDRVAELRERVYEEMKDVRRKTHLSNRDLKARVDSLFDDFES